MGGSSTFTTVLCPNSAGARTSIACRGLVKEKQIHNSVEIMIVAGRSTNGVG